MIRYLKLIFFNILGCHKQNITSSEVSLPTIRVEDQLEQQFGVCIVFHNSSYNPSHKGLDRGKEQLLLVQ